MAKTNTTTKKTAPKMLTDVKKLTELATAENCAAILANDDVFIDSLTKSELLKVVIFGEIKKALDNDTHEAIIQCNYDCTQHSESNAYNLIRFVEKAKHQNALTNIYVTIKKDTVLCKCTVSANKTYQDALEKAGYNILKHFKTVELKDLAAEIKTLYAIFTSTHQ
jgi:CDGSH-type Zn-finger protein